MKGQRTLVSILAPIATDGAIDPKDPLRKPHRVTRRLVMREGQEAPRNLYAWFDLFNETYFGGKLATPSLWIAPTSSPRAEGEYTARDVHGMQSVIRIRPSTYKLGDRFAIACLLHEMIHAYQSEVLSDLEPGYKGHGPKFCIEANRIAVSLGFAECAPKGRNGKARAETWPILPPDPDAPPATAVEGDEGADPDAPDDPDEPVEIAARLHPKARAERDAVLAYIEALARSLWDPDDKSLPDAVRATLGKGIDVRVKVLKFVSFEIERGAHVK